MTMLAVLLRLLRIVTVAVAMSFCGETGAVVGYVDGKRLGGGLLFPGDEGTAHDLVSEAASAFEMEADRGRLLRVDTLEDKLVEQVVVVAGEGEGLLRSCRRASPQRCRARPMR